MPASLLSTMMLSLTWSVRRLLVVTVLRWLWCLCPTIPFTRHGPSPLHLLLLLRLSALIQEGRRGVRVRRTRHKIQLLRLRSSDVKERMAQDFGGRRGTTGRVWVKQPLDHRHCLRAHAGPCRTVALRALTLLLQLTWTRSRVERETAAEQDMRYHAQCV